MKKILLINDYLSHIWWAEKVVYDIKQLLTEQWNTVLLLWGKNTKDSFFSFVERYFSISYFFKTLTFFKKNEVDIIHAHAISRNISPSPLLAAKLKRKRIIMTVHDFHYYCPKTWGVRENWKICELWFNSTCFLRNCVTYKRGIKNIPYHFLKWLKVWLHRIIIKHCVDVFICPSKKLQEYMIYSLKLPKEKVIYLPNFVEIPKNHSLDFSHVDPKTFLYVGRISKEKWIDVAINAIVYLVKERNLTDIKLQIIWDGPEKERLEKLVSEKWLQNNIYFLGRIENEKLWDYYNSAIALLMPSVWLENNPLVAIEGMKYGKAILASNVGGFPDLVEDGKNGYLFPMGNHLALAEKILKLYDNTALSETMGKYGFEKLQREFGAEKYYEKVMEIYKV